MLQCNWLAVLLHCAESYCVIVLLSNWVNALCQELVLQCSWVTVLHSHYIAVLLHCAEDCVVVWLSKCVTALCRELLCYSVSWVSVVVHCFKCCVTVTCGVLLMPSVQVWWYSITCVIYLIIPYHLSCANSNVALCLLTSSFHFAAYVNGGAASPLGLPVSIRVVLSVCYQCGCTVQQKSRNLRYYSWAIWEPFFPMNLSWSL